MNNGEKILALMRERGWGYADVAQAVQAQGAKTVKYQHIQQLVLFPKRVPRYILELAAAFGMTAEEFRDWKPGRDRAAKYEDHQVREATSTYGAPDLSAEVRELSLALVLVADWIRESRPMEAPALLATLKRGRKQLGGTGPQSTLALMVEALRPAEPAAASHSAKKSG